MARRLLGDGDEARVVLVCDVCAREYPAAAPYDGRPDKLELKRYRERDWADTLTGLEVCPDCADRIRASDPERLREAARGEA